MLDLSGSTFKQVAPVFPPTGSSGLADMSMASASAMLNMSGQRCQPAQPSVPPATYPVGPVAHTTPVSLGNAAAPSKASNSVDNGRPSDSGGVDDRHGSGGTKVQDLKGLALSQADCCLRFVVMLLGTLVELPRLIQELRNGSDVELRVGCAVNAFGLCIAGMGFLSLVAVTAHMVNLIAVLLTIMTFLVEARPIQFTAATEVVLKNFAVFQMPLGLAAVHCIQGMMFLALWYDYDIQSYALAGVTANLACVVHFYTGRWGARATPAAINFQ